MNNMFLILFSALAVVVIISLTLPTALSSQIISDEDRLMVHPNDSNEWNLYKKRFKKTYLKTEDQNHRNIFIKTSEMIQNMKDNKSYTFELVCNKFTDYDFTEKMSRLGVDFKHVSTKSKVKTPTKINDSSATPIDFRHCLGPVKDQGKYPASFAFSAIAALEYAYCKKNYNKKIALSEQQIVSCFHEKFPYSAWNFLIKEGGSFSSIDYPYTSGNSGKKGNCLSKTRKKIAEVSNFFKISGDLIDAIHEYGVLSVIMTVVDNFYSYWHGVYKDSTCTPRSKPANHAVAIVGFGFYELDYTRTVKDTKHWIVRNSWGSDWGTEGYFLIERGVNMCKIETYVYAVEVK